jgi:YD repeat-containing protein
MKKLVLSSAVCLLLLISSCTNSLLEDTAEVKSKLNLDTKTGNNGVHNRIKISRKLSTLVTNGVTQVVDVYYNYDTRGNLIQITGSSPNQAAFDIDITYDNRDRVKAIDNNTTARWEYTYDGNDLVKQLRTIGLNGNISSINFYEIAYDANGKMSGVNWYAVENGVNRLVTTYTFGYSGDDIILSTEKLASGVVYRTYEFTYDNQKQPFYNLPLLSIPRFIVQDMPGISFSEHNILTQTAHDRGTAYSAINSFKASYTYTADGYPSKVQKMFGQGSVETTVYTYAPIPTMANQKNGKSLNAYYN